MTQYLGIRSEGGLIPYDILDKIANEESGFGQQAKDFGLAAGRRLTDEIAHAWSDAQDYWHIFQRRSEGLPESETGTTLTRKWGTDLLNELLGYQLTYQPTGAVISGKNYPISHRAGAGEESPPIDIEGIRIDLDRRQQARRLSPQALVQEYLNNSDEHLWGLVTNGMLLRLLRDTSRTSRPSYLEFDLQSILDGNRFNEFSLFYRVCHRSRLPTTAEDSTSCWLEKYFQISVEQGGRVRDKLRDGVEDALKSLGTGLLRHPKNDALRERITSQKLTAPEFHRQLLRLVYRLLFLMVAEDRRMIVPEAPDSERRQRLYDTYYSVGRLRTLTEKLIERSTFGDLWLSLQSTFTLFESRDSNPLGIPPLNGDLFSHVAVRDLQDTHLYNDDLLAAIRRLSLFEERRILQRVNYGALDVEELGSVYEGLLEFQPVFVDEAEGKKFDLRVGSERKSTGSYYTRPELVRELIESALVPVMRDRLANAKDSDPANDKKMKQQAILAMSVCDPACGSGHFLLAAARRLGRELAKVKTGEDEPTPKEFHLAVRDVISHCVYGVDMNPLAVDLCKLALWLEGHWTGKPLSFLDHRIKCGNSLIGVLDPSVLKDGIPNDAFTSVTGDDRKVANAFKKANKEERKGQPSLPFDAAEHVHQYAEESNLLLTIVEDTPADVRRKEEIYRKSREQRQWLHDWTAANLLTAAFFVPLTKYDDPEVPTQESFMNYLLHGKDRPQMTGYANALSVERHFFHWRLEFSPVFDHGGFDVVVGNPPWERLNVQEKEFFANRAPDIAKAPNKASRFHLLQQLATEKPRLWKEYQSAVRLSATVDKFLRGSGRFRLTAQGDINTYSVFAELGRLLLNSSGRVGLILPIGIATDETTSEFFRDLVDNNCLVQLLGFENESFIFPAVHHSFKFCALTTAANSDPSRPVRLTFFCRNFSDVGDQRRSFSVPSHDLKLLSPNTRSCPIFRTAMDAKLTTKIYRSVPILADESRHDNPWRVELRRMFHMADDSDKFCTATELAEKGAKRKGWGMSRDGEVWLPLYEAKLIHQFDHRFATFEGATQANLNAGILPHPSSVQKGDPQYHIAPRYWIDRKYVDEKLGDWRRPWLVGFRDVTSAVVERTTIVSLLPRLGVGHNCPLVFFPNDPTTHVMLFLANLNSLIFDYCARQKIGGNHLTFSVLNQLPVLAPQSYSKADHEFINSRVLELVATSDELTPFAEETGYVGTPFKWDELRRAGLRAELDAYYAHLYGLTRAELCYVLDPKDVFGEDFPSETFRVLKEREEKQYDEYRTRRLVLEAFDKLVESPRFLAEMPKRESVFTVPELTVESRK